jgi:hypothetical protein
VAESGYPGFDADQWYAALALPDVLQSFADQGAEPVRAAPEVFADLIARELPRWRDVVRGADMKVE